MKEKIIAALMPNDHLIVITDIGRIFERHVHEGKCQWRELASAPLPPLEVYHPDNDSKINLMKMSEK